MTSGVTPARGADEILARDYERLRGDVTAALRGKLVAQRVHVDPSDLDAFYNQAWHTLYSRLADGHEVENRTGFLVTVAYRRAIDEIRRLQPDHLETDTEVTTVGVDVDFAGRLDDAATVRHLVEGMRERLNERERHAAALCLIHGYTRPEAAEVLDVTPKRMEKIMDGVTRKLALLTGEISDDWCRSRESLVNAYALGLLDEGGERHAAAVEHLRECSACRRYVNTRRGLASVLPPVWIPLATSGAVAAGVGSGVAGGGGILGLLRHARHAARPRSPVHVAAAAGGGAAAIAALVLALTGAFGGSHHKPPLDAAQPPTTVPTTPAPAPRSRPATVQHARHRAAPPHRAHRAKRAKAKVAATPARTAVVAATPTVVATTPPAAPPPPPQTSPPPPPAATPPPAAPPATPTPHKARPVTDGAQEFGPEH